MNENEDKAYRKALLSLPVAKRSALETDDFAEVFGEATSYGSHASNPPIGFKRADVAEAYLIEEGENDGDPWRAIGRLEDGRFFRASGECDYTGWDCQSSNRGETWDTWSAFVCGLCGLGDEDRAKLRIADMSAPPKEA